MEHLLVRTEEGEVYTVPSKYINSFLETFGVVSLLGKFEVKVTPTRFTASGVMKAEYYFSVYKDGVVKYSRIIDLGSREYGPQFTTLEEVAGAILLKYPSVNRVLLQL
jgi:hypothetical protein